MTPLAAYLQRRDANEAFNQESQAGELRQAGALQSLMANAEKQRREQSLRQGLAKSGGDPERAMEIALQSGDYEAAKQLAPLVEIKRKDAETRALSGIDMSDPAALRKAALTLKKPEFITHAERLEKGQQDEATLRSMQSKQIVQPDQQEVQQSADQGTPPVQPARNGGSFADLMESEIPSIAQAARNYQAQMDSASAKSIPPTYWTNVQKQLQDRETALLSRKPSSPHYLQTPDGYVAVSAPGAPAQPVLDNKGNRVKPMNAAGESTPTITDDTLAMDAWRYLTDGTLPPNMGRGMQGAAQATKIRNESARLAKEMGMTPDEIRMAQLTNKAQVGAIGQLARAKAQILQFEKTASYNADLALEASKDVWRTGSPLFNKPVQWIRENATGDPKALVFNAATETFVSEYARVMSGGYGAAQTTEGAQQRAHKLLNTSHTDAQFGDVIKQLKREMENRVKALNAQMDEERQNLRRGVNPRAATPQPVTPPPAAPSASGAGWTPDKEQRYQELLKRRGGGS